MFKLKLPKQEQGFTLIEVLVAILVASIFITVTMQIMAVAAIFKVRAQEFAEATTWIQEDLENVKYQAANYQYTSLSAAASSSGSVLQVASASLEAFEFTQGDTLLVGTDSTNNTIAIAGINTATGQITLTSPLSTNWLTDTPVVATTRCNPPSGTLNVGFADGLRDWISDTNHNDGITDITNDSNPVNISKSSKVFTRKTYNIRRTTTISNTLPYNALQITYEVLPTSSLGGAISGPSIANFYTEVIPNAALQCPN